MPIVNNPYVIGNSSTDTQNFRLQSGNDGTLTLARKSDGSGGNILTVASDGKVSLPQGETLTASKLQSGTAQASTSGTSIDFTGIPSWAKRITVMLDGVSTNGTSNLIVRLGSGSYLTSGYIGTTTYGGTSAFETVGLPLARMLVNTVKLYGTLTLYNVSGNIWTSSGITNDDGSRGFYNSGSITLGGVLDRVRITSVTPDTFDAGSINIMWE